MFSLHDSLETIPASGVKDETIDDVEEDVAVQAAVLRNFEPMCKDPDIGGKIFDGPVL